MKRAARWVLTAMIAVGLVALTASPAAAQRGPAYLVEESQQELQAQIDECEQLAANPAPTNRADKDTLEKWAACAELRGDAIPSALDRDGQWFGSSAYTEEGFALSAYTLYFDQGAWDQWGRKTMGGIMVVAWTVGVWALRAAAWAFDWVVNGRVTDILIGIPEAIRDEIIATEVLGGMLGPLAILAASAAAAFAIVRRRTAEGVSHLAWLILVIGIGTLVMSDVDRYFDGVRVIRNELGESIIDTTGIQRDANGNVDSGALLAPLMSPLVHDPWEQLNWGQRLSDQDCIEKASRVLTRRGSAVSDWARDEMRGCPSGTNAASDHAHNPSATRTFAAALIGLTQLFIALLVMSVALIALGSELMLAAAFAMLPVAIVLAAFPGGRSIAAGWLSMVIQGTIGLAFGILMLRIVEIVFVALANSPAGQALPMLGLFLVLALAALLGLRYRRRLPEAGRALSKRLGSRAASIGSGGGGGGGAVAAGAAGAAGGLLGGLALARSAGPPGGSAALAAGARAARRAGQGTLSGSAQLAAARNPEGKLARTLGSTKAAGGAGIAMGTALAGAQAFGSRRATGRAARDAGGVSRDRASELIDSRRRKKQLLAAKSTSASADTLAKAAVSRHGAVRAAAAAHPNTSERVRSDLAESKRPGTMRRRHNAGQYEPPSDTVPLGGNAEQAAGPSPQPRSAANRDDA